MSNHKFDTHIGEIAVEISFDYQPAECAGRYYPGCEESVDLCSVEMTQHPERVDILAILSKKAIADLETESFEHLSDGPSD